MYPLIPIFLLFATTLLAQAESPKQGTLAIDTQIPLVMEGKTVGSMTLKAGAAVTIVQVLPDNQVLISRGDSTNTFKVSKESLTPESLAVATATPTPTPLPTPAPVVPEAKPAVATTAPTVSSVTPNAKPNKKKLTIEELEAQTIPLIKNGKIINGTGTHLEDYAYNPFTNEKPEDLIILLKDITGPIGNPQNGETDEEAKKRANNSAVSIKATILGLLPPVSTPNPNETCEQARARYVRTFEQLQSAVDQNNDTWTIGCQKNRIVLIPKISSKYPTKEISLFDISEDKLLKIVPNLPDIIDTHGRSFKFTGIKKYSNELIVNTIRNNEGKYYSKNLGKYMGWGEGIVRQTPESIAAILSN